MYQPEIPNELISKLYQIKTETGKAMTVLVAQAIREFIAKYELEEKHWGASSNKNTQ